MNTQRVICIGSTAAASMKLRSGQVTVTRICFPCGGLPWSATRGFLPTRVHVSPPPKPKRRHRRSDRPGGCAAWTPGAGLPYTRWTQAARTAASQPVACSGWPSRTLQAERNNKKTYFKRCASDSERERHCARFLRKFRENTVVPYATLLLAPLRRIALPTYRTLRLAPLRRIALLLPYPTARASKAHRPTPTLLLPYARRGGPTTTAASARRSCNTVAPYYYPTY